MKVTVKPGDERRFTTQVTADKLARFEAGTVHPLYSTFALAQDAEWACRLFVLDMLEPGEEGIGSYVSVRHLAPTPLGAEVTFVARAEAVEGNRILCSWQAFWGDVCIAQGEQEQHILDKARFVGRIAKLQAKLK